MQPLENRNALVESLKDQEALNAIYIVSDPTRMQIMQILSVHGALCAHEILSYFNISQPTLSHHMSQLCDHKLVDSKKDGRRVFYSVSEAGINNIIQLFKKMLECTYEKEVIKEGKKESKPAGMKRSPMLPKPKKAIKKPDVPKENVINKSKPKKKDKTKPGSKKIKSEDKKKDVKKGKGKKKGKKKNN